MLDREIIPAKTYVKYAKLCDIGIRLKEILDLCWVTITDCGCPIYGTSEDWDTGETWCYTIVCPTELYDEVDSYYECLDTIGLRLNTVSKGISNDLRPFGGIFILRQSDLQDMKHMLTKELLEDTFNLLM